MFGSSFSDFPVFIPFVLQDVSGKSYGPPALLTLQESGVGKLGPRVRATVACAPAPRPCDDALEEESYCLMGSAVAPVGVIGVTQCGDDCGGACKVGGICGRSSVDPKGLGFFSSFSMGALVSAGLVELGLEGACCDVTLTMGSLRLDASMVGGAFPAIAAFDAAAAEVFFPQPAEPCVLDVEMPVEEVIHTQSAAAFVEAAAEAVLTASDASVVLDSFDADALPIDEVGPPGGGGHVAAVVELLHDIVAGVSPASPGLYGGDPLVEIDRRIAVLGAGGTLPRGCYGIVGDHNWFNIVRSLTGLFSRLGVPCRGVRMDLLLGGLSICRDDRLRALRLLRFLGCGGVDGDATGVGRCVSFAVPISVYDVDRRLASLVFQRQSRGLG